MPRRLSPAPLLWLYAVSGFSALALETGWMRVISQWAGNTVVASAVVIVVFFMAAALGNLWGARLVAKASRPLHYYGRFEVASGFAAAATFAAASWLRAHAAALPSGWLGTLVATALLVGPPSLLAGVAFPSLAQTFVPGADRRTASGAPFYAMNLLGAALGVSAGGVILPWWIGVKATVLVAAGVQCLGGLVAWRIAHRAGPSPSRVSAATQTGAAWLGWTLLAASGLLSLAVQSLLIVWARQIVEGSVYAIAGVLTMFIGGLGIGAFVAGALRYKGRAPTEIIALFSGLSALFLFFVPDVGSALVDRAIDLTGATPTGMLVQALCGSLPCLLPLTICLGGVFPSAWELAHSRTPHEGRVLGFALATNKLGAAAGALIGMFVILPMCGLPRGTVVLGWLYLLIAGGAVFSRQSLTSRVVLAGVFALGVWQTAKPRAPLGLTPELRAIADYTGAYGPVVVVEERAMNSRQIILNSRQRLSGTQRALSSQLHQSWVPLLFCSHPERVMTIGMASGISAAAALDLPVHELHAVELVPEVAQAAREHFGEWNRALFTDPRVHLHTGDGRIVLDRLPGNLDAIVCDLFFPSEDGTANLYAREFFDAARARLNPGGVFCLWLPCYQHTAQTAGSIVRTFSDAFPSAIVVRSNFDPLQPVIGLLGSNEPLPISREFLASRLSARSSFFRSPENAWLLIAGDLHASEPGFSEFPPTTDDHPLLAFLGPRRPLPRERLVGMIFLDWIGKRFVRPLYPSCNLGDTSPSDILASVRAGNLYFAAAVAGSVVPGDTRPEAVRAAQTSGYFERARALQPAASFPREALGR